MPAAPAQGSALSALLGALLLPVLSAGTAAAAPGALEALTEQGGDKCRGFKRQPGPRLASCSAGQGGSPGCLGLAGRDGTGWPAGASSEEKAVFRD